jgi:hypothetical protein
MLGMSAALRVLVICYCYTRYDAPQHPRLRAARGALARLRRPSQIFRPSVCVRVELAGSEPRAKAGLWLIPFLLIVQ